MAVRGGPKVRGAGIGTRLVALGAVAVLATLTGGCGPVGTVGTQGTRPPGPGQSNVHLVAFDSCPQLLDQVRREALAELRPSGLAAGVAGYGDGIAYATNGTTSGPAPMAPDAEAAPAAAGSTEGTSAAGSGTGGQPSSQPSPPGTGGSYSTTNDQEAGVDEPDLAKTDGSLLVALRRDSAQLQIADVGSSPPRLRGSLSLGSVLSPTGIFLVGHDAVVLGNGPQPAPGPLPEQSAPDSRVSSGGLTVSEPDQSPTTVVTVVDLADPDRPAVSRSFTLQGAAVDARLVDGEVEVVVASGPRLPFVAPADSSAQSEDAALAANSELVRRSNPADWLPSVTTEPGGTTRTSSCTAAMHPDVASGLGTVSVVPIDPSASQPGQELTVVGDATTVYASASSLYVATTSWPQLEAEGVVPSAGGAVAGPALAVPSTPATTDIHGFDLSDPATPTYLGSAEVPGTLIGQYALSEYQGYLRVATTVGSAAPPSWEGAAPATPSDNRVTVLQPQNGSLVEVGSVTALGTGEKIDAVRFIGPLGYVVTFRQTDPLFVLDLSDPHHPQANGQLELTGYSSFLEPLPDGRLLGIGQDVNQSLRSDGLQLSLFDVTDPSHPSLLSKDVLPGASSSAQDDPHALLWWAPAQLAVLPVTQQEVAPIGTEPPTGGPPSPLSGAMDSETSPFDGAVAFHVTDTTVTEAGRITQPPAEASAGSATPPPQPLGVSGSERAGVGVAVPQVVFAGRDIERSLVVGSMLYTVSETGILASDLSTFQSLTWLAYS